MNNDITKELADVLHHIRKVIDERDGEIYIGPQTMVRIDAILDRYDDACNQMPNEDAMAIVDDILDRYAEPFMTPEKPKMDINLKDYEGKLVVASLRNGWRIVSNVYKNGGDEYDYKYFPYSIDGKNYSTYGRILISQESPYDIVDIKLADEDPEPSMINCLLEGNPPNECLAWNIWYEKFGSKGVLHGLKISSLDYKPIPPPEPIITRVEVITDNGRVYTNWEKDNVITTSLQDDGRTLKIFVTKNTEETMYPKQPKPINMVEIESKRWANALSVLIEELSPHGSLSLWDYEGKTPTPEKVVECLRLLMKYREQSAASKQWATALSGLIDELGGDSPALWEWKGITPTPEKVVECLRELVDFHMSIAADNELDECCEWLTDQSLHLDGSYLRAARRTQPTLKSQALRDFETVRKHSDLLPEILDNIENALKSIPDT